MAEIVVEEFRLGDGNSTPVAIYLQMEGFSRMVSLRHFGDFNLLIRPFEEIFPHSGVRRNRRRLGGRKKRSD